MKFYVNLKVSIITILVLSFLQIKAQNTRWFECKYFNQGTDIDYLYNPYSRLEASRSKSRLLISADDYGITIYNSNGPSYFYKHKLIKYNLNNGKKIELHEGINEERQYYMMGITAPIGLSRNLYDSSITIATRTKANLYGTVLLFDLNTKEQVRDVRLSVSVDSSIILNKTDQSEALANAKKILVMDGSTLAIDGVQYELQIIKGSESSRHYVIKNFGTELLIRESNNLFTFSISTTDGGLVRIYTSRK